MQIRHKSSAAQRLLQVISALKGHSLQGLTNGELARLLKETPVNISRTLKVLGDAGMVTSLSGGRYVLGPTLLQIALAHLEEIQRAQSKLNEMGAGVLASPASQ
jgi:DNA-binding IclR family transcriptional regulator